MSGLDTLVDKEMRKDVLAQFYLKLRPCPAQDKTSLLNRMDEYVRLSRSKKAVKTREFDELETTLKFDIYRIIEDDFYEEIKSSLAIPTQVLENYKALPDEKKALFRQGVMAVPHREKGLMPALKQKTIA